jgi:Flp pilus assembly protein TadD
MYIPLCVFVMVSIIRAVKIRHFVFFCVISLLMAQLALSNTLSLTRAARIALQNRDYDRLIKIYTKLLEIDFKDYVWYTLRGDARYEKGDYEGAIADYTKGIELSIGIAQKQGPKKGDFAKAYQSWSHSGRGRCWLQKGDDNRAISDFNKGVEIQPKYGGLQGYDAYCRRAQYYQHKGEYELALFDYEQALRIQPGDENAIRGYETALKLQMQEARALVDATSKPQRSDLADISRFHIAARPGIQIHSIKINPDRMPPKTPFDLMFEFSVTEPSMKQHEILVTFHYTILAGKEVLFTSKPKVIVALNGKRTQRVVHLIASNQRRAYEIEVFLEYKNNHRELSLKKVSAEFLID